MVLPDYTTQDPATYKANIDAEVAQNQSDIASARISAPVIKATTSGTSVDWSNIPSSAKKITFTFSDVSLDASSSFNIQLGTGGVATTSGYAYGQSAILGTTPSTLGSTSATAIYLGGPNAAGKANGTVTVTKISNTEYTITWVIGFTSTSGSAQGGGEVTLSGVMDYAKIFSVDNFDSGQIAMHYQG